MEVEHKIMEAQIGNHSEDKEYLSFWDQMGTKWLDQFKIRQFAKGFFTMMLAVFRGETLDSVVTKGKSEKWRVAIYP